MQNLNPWRKQTLGKILDDNTISPYVYKKYPPMYDERGQRSYLIAKRIKDWGIFWIIKEQKISWFIQKRSQNSVRHLRRGFLRNWAGNTPLHKLIPQKNFDIHGEN